MGTPARLLAEQISEPEWGELFELAPVEVFEFADWVCTPVQLREPKTRAEWSELFGVPGTLRTQMEQHPEFQRLVITKNKGTFSPLSVLLVNENLERAATDTRRTDVRAIELFLRQTGTLRPVATVQANISLDDPSKMDEDALQAEYDRIMAKRPHGAIETKGEQRDD